MAKKNKAESYWERRSIELEEKWNTMSRETIEKELAAYYRQSLQHIQKDIEALYGTFSKDNKVSMTEARKILQGDEYRVWRMDIKEYIREIEKLAATGAASKSNELLRELNTLAMRSRITRLDKLYAETLAELGRLAGKTEAGMDKFLTDAYKDGYYRNLYEIGKKAGLKSMPSKVDSSKVENVLRTPWSGKNYSQRIWGNDAKLGERIKETITQGIHRGSSIGQLSRQLADRMGVGFHDAERLVRTELNYVQNRAALEGIKDAGMGFYRFVATLDNRTTQTCISHDGHVFPVEEASPGDNMPPLHARCRSTICASLGEEGSRGGRRIARNKDDKNIRVPEEMRYNDWKAVYIDKSKSWKAWTGEAGYKGREMFKRYTPYDIFTVTDMYKDRAQPGQGVVSFQEGFRYNKHAQEISIANMLHALYGGDIELLEENRNLGRKSPDFIWNGKAWDLKTLSTEKAADSAVRGGLKQIQSNPGGLILDCGDKLLNLDLLISILDSRMGRRYRGDVDILIVSKGQVKTIRRYKNKQSRSSTR